MWAGLTFPCSPPPVPAAALHRLGGARFLSPPPALRLFSLWLEDFQHPPPRPTPPTPTSPITTAPPIPLAWPKEASAPVNSLTRTLFALRCRKERASAVKSEKVSVRLSSSPPPRLPPHTPSVREAVWTHRRELFKSHFPSKEAS